MMARVDLMEASSSAMAEAKPTGDDLFELGMIYSAGVDVRQDLVARVRQEIQAGTYDTPEKLEAALDRLAARLAAD